MNLLPPPIWTHKKNPPQKSQLNFLPPGLPHLLQLQLIAFVLIIRLLLFCL